jgi:uncharacterized membrane protein YhaH (DUF805 family)
MDWGKLFSFEGRVSRQPFWIVTIGVVVVDIIAALLVQSGSTIPVILGILLYIPTIVVALAITIKRWHDRDKSGWWIFISLVPLIGGIWALVENGFLAGTPGPNQYGTVNGGSPLGS